MPTRRTLTLSGAALLAGVGASSAAAAADGAAPLFGQIAQITAKPGARDDLARILLEGSARMPGCLSYVVAKDPANADALWITKVWRDEASHTAALNLPEVRAAIGKGLPMITGSPVHAKTEPIGGVGL
jgi:quinol monooxygenase YgiN